MSIKLYVGNLLFQTSSEDLQQLFGQAGTVESASVVEDRDTGRSRGFGFVEMSSKEEGEAAIARFNGTVIGRRNLTVHKAMPRENRKTRRAQAYGFIEIAVDKEASSNESRAILIGPVKEVTGSLPALIGDEEVEKQVEVYFTEISESRKRARKTQTEINRLKKKTQAILDKIS
jgi:RNA recognition motif-containing protein